MTLTQFSCPHCQSVFQVGPESAGQQAACPHCGGLVGIPATGIDPAGIHLGNAAPPPGPANAPAAATSGSPLFPPGYKAGENTPDSTPSTPFHPDGGRPPKVQTGGPADPPSAIPDLVPSPPNVVAPPPSVIPAPPSTISPPPVVGEPVATQSVVAPYVANRAKRRFVKNVILASFCVILLAATLWMLLTVGPL